MRRRILLLGALVAVLFVFIGGALIYEQANNGRKLGLLDLYQRIDIGMPREQVEAILGPPIFANDDPPGGGVQAHYLDQEYAERSLLPHESPFLPVGISV